MSTRDRDMKEWWDASFEEQERRGAYNTAPVEALVRNIAYYLRDRVPEERIPELHFLEIGSGAGPNLLWLAAKGMKVSGVDISTAGLELARGTLTGAGFGDRVGELVEASASSVPLPDESFDGVIEACVFQHLNREDRVAAFREVDRLVKPGGLFAGYMLEAGHTVYQQLRDKEDADDPGTLDLQEGGSKVFLTELGLSHFYRADEVRELLPGWEIVDPCLATYYLPEFEARKRGYDSYMQSMLAVYAVK